MKNKNKLFIIPILILVFVVFYPSTRLFFARDDWGFLPQKVYSFSSFWELFIPKGVWFYRPLTQEIYFFINKLLFGFNAYFYHLSNVIYMVANTLLVYLIARKLFKKEFPSIITASFYGLNSLHLFSVYWIAGFYQLGTTFLMLLSFYLFMLYVEKKSLLFIAGSTFLYILSLFSGEMSVFLPFLITIYVYLFGAKAKKKGKFLSGKYIKVLLPFYFLLFTYLVFYFSNISLPSEDYQRNFNLVSVSKTFIKYSLYPFFAGYDRASVLSSVNLLMIVRALTILAVSIYILLRRRLYPSSFRLYAFGALWFLITVSIFTTLPGHTFAYLVNVPSIGISLIIGLAFSDIFSRMKKDSSKPFFIALFISINLLIIVLVRGVDPDLRWHRRISDLGRRSYDSIKELYPTIPKNAAIKVFYDDDDALDGTYFGNLIKAVYYEYEPSVELIKGTDRIIRGRDDILLIWKAGRFYKL